MPTIRCSNEVYELLQAEALKEHEPVSIVLDRLIFVVLKERGYGATGVQKEPKGRAAKGTGGGAKAAKKRAKPAKKRTKTAKKWLWGVEDLTE